MNKKEWGNASDTQPNACTQSGGGIRSRVAGTAAVALPFLFFFQAEDGIRDPLVTGVQTCALPIYSESRCWPPCPGTRSGSRCWRRSPRPSRSSGRIRPPSRCTRRSEERRVGKECRSRWSPYHEQKRMGERVRHAAECMHAERRRNQEPSSRYRRRCSAFSFFFSSRRRHTRSTRDWSSDVCSSDLLRVPLLAALPRDSEWLAVLAQVAETVALIGAHPAAEPVYEEIGRASCRERV